MVRINDKIFKMSSTMPNSTGQMLSLLLVLGFMLTIVHPVLAQDTPAEVGVFDPIEVAPGEVVQVPISIRNIRDLYGVDVMLEFDPAVVQVIDADAANPGVQAALGDFLDPGLLLFNTADNTAGTYHFVMAQYNPSEPKSGQGVVVIVTFKGLKEGTSPLTIPALKLASREGIEIASEGVDGTLSVVAGAPTQAVTFAAVLTTGLVELSTFTPTPTTPPPTSTPQPTLEPTQPPPAQTETNGGSVEKDEDTNTTYWLVNNWWVILILLGLVISAGVYLFGIRKGTQKKE